MEEKNPRGSRQVLCSINTLTMRLLISAIFLLTTTATFGQVEAISKVLQVIDRRENLSGVVLVGLNGHIVFEKAYGKANRSFDIPNGVETKFLIGSMTKQFTAVLVMQQVENGILNLDAPIANYLPDFRRDTGGRITIRHLLTHTHGIPNPELTERYKPMEREEFVKTYCQSDLEFAPGTEFRYSNVVGYYLLGVILEKVTRTDYATLLDQKIFNPLGMSSSGYYNHSLILKGMATGYVKQGDGFVGAPYWDISQSFSAAGAYSTVEDLFKWHQALNNSVLLSEGSLKMVFTPYSEKVRYGLGWYINDPEINGRRHIFVGHAGGASGFRSQIMRGIEDDIVVIFLSNSDKFVEVREPLIEAMLNQ